jgi:hypothetical protein
MTPRDQNILNTLNLLVLVFRAQKQTYPALDEEQQHTLKITYEHIKIAGLTVPVFLNTLTELNAKGYLFALSVFEEKFQPEIQKFLDDETYSKILDEVAKHDTSELVEKFKVAGVAILQENLPANISIPPEEFLNEELDMKMILDSAREVMKGYTPDVLATVILSPFRGVERLLEKMNTGMSFENVKDAGVWYDSVAYELHFDESTISTAYQGKPSKAHFALQALFGEFGNTTIYYDDIPESEWQKGAGTENKAYRDALNRLLKKHPRLTDLFTVHADHLAIHETYLEHPH